MTEILFSNSVGIRKAGFDEYWLQDRIFENPHILKLGDLEAISREKTQSSGGRLDLLLKSPKDDSMYEVEVMLGETNESHIIRTIEYWDNEKRRWPQRQHFAVIVAEIITRRFFNVIQLLSQSIPIIAIQVDLIKVGDQQALHFTKVLDVYQEPEEVFDGPVANIDESYWNQISPWTLNHAKLLKDLLKDIEPNIELRFVKNYIALSLNGYNSFGLNKRTSNKSNLGFRINETISQELAPLLDQYGVSFTERSNSIYFLIDDKMLTENKDFFKKLYMISKTYWE